MSGMCEKMALITVHTKLFDSIGRAAVDSVSEEVQSMFSPTKGRDSSAFRTQQRFTRRYSATHKMFIGRAPERRGCHCEAYSLTKEMSSLGWLFLSVKVHCGNDGMEIMAERHAPGTLEDTLDAGSVKKYRSKTCVQRAALSALSPIHPFNARKAQRRTDPHPLLYSFQ